jgi:endonuclease YncB( thermonuclease family)
MLRLIAVALIYFVVGSSAQALQGKEYAVPRDPYLGVLQKFNQRYVTTKTGDTFKYAGRTIRLYGIEAPTIGYACENARALVAKTNLNTQLKTGGTLSRKIASGVHHRKGWEVWQVFKNGTNINTALLAGTATNGIRAYSGGAKTPRSGC